jgi:hypothetical protein
MKGMLGDRLASLQKPLQMNHAYRNQRAAIMLKSSFVSAAIVGFWGALSVPAMGTEPIVAVDAKAFPKAEQPQLAADASGKIYLVFGEGKSVYCTSSEDGAKTFSQPVRVGGFPSMALGRRRGPRIVATEKAVVVTAIGGTVGRGTDESLQAWRSADGGKTWQGPV